MQVAWSRVDSGDVLELRIRDTAENARPDDGDVTLELRQREAPRGRPVRVTAGRVSDERIRADLSDLALADGTWEVLWRGEGAAPRPVRTTDPGFGVAERLAYLERPRQRELRPLRDPDGRLLVRVASVLPYAEVTWVETSSEGLGFVGTLAYAPRVEDGTTARVVARQREGTGVVAGEAAFSGGSFRGTLPVAPLGRTHDSSRPTNEWDLWLHLGADPDPNDATDENGAGTDELRLGAHADDITGKKKKFVFPEVRLPESRLGAHPYYTIADNLSVQVKEAEAAKR